MSDVSSAENSSADAAAKPQQKPRTSRVGRIVIGILLLVVAVEGIAALRVYMAKSKLTGELAKSDAEDYQVTRGSVKEILGNREPDDTKLVQAHVGKELYDMSYFSGLLKRRILCVHYGIQGEKDADDSKREMMEVLTVIPEAVLYADET
ncbi:MAG: hypothetical protein ABGZ17_01825 [Planctomycetaceae bacterium]|jgi:hypothetical protein